MRFVVISACLAEAAIILCETYPSFPGSDSIRALFHGTSYSSIHISRTFLVGWALLATGTYLASHATDISVISSPSSLHCVPVIDL
ncbi:hypothetical protein A0H81_10671 [Grifola frondosa]|uniref:Uncharacterized protein n=1 Tax=Grifola frondosa TaxID=5627 RepID=A0A1C7LZ03_GRIFR|nr:hypothetical protein A0H81_10671 [Grifola frondosa]